MKLFSLIVPVYNTAEFLPKCLDSILAQDHLDIELIIINDGSTDCSLEIIKKYAEADARVIWRNQRNMGLSAARNHGLRLATGEHIIFVDSDDWIETTLCSRIAATSTDSNADIIVFNAQIHDQNRTYRMLRKPPIAKLDSNDWLVSSIKQRSFPGAVWLHCYKRSFIQDNQLSFLEGQYSEELHWTVIAMLKARRITCINEDLYHYRVRPGSIMKCADPNHLIRRLRSYCQIIPMLDSTAREMIGNGRVLAWIRHVLADNAVMAQKLPGKLAWRNRREAVEILGEANLNFYPIRHAHNTGLRLKAIKLALRNFYFLLSAPRAPRPDLSARARQDKADTPKRMG